MDPPTPDPPPPDQPEPRRSSDTLFDQVYAQLRAIAAEHMRRERVGHSLQATALVHEAYVRIGARRPDGWTSLGQFYSAAAEAMRRILIEHARLRGRVKRGGGRRCVPLSVLDLAAEQDEEQIMAVDAAVRRLDRVDRDAAEVVRLRFFAGLSVEQTAEALGISARTAKRDWAFARAWLHGTLQGEIQAGLPPMSEHDWRRAKEVFGEAMDLPAEECAKFLDAACAGIPELRARVEGLLASHSAAGEFLGAPTVSPPGPEGEAVSTFIPPTAPPVAAGEGVGQRIGPYTLLSIVGEGGFGVVYAAEQHQPLHRRVALKVIKLGMDTRQVIARFEQERQSLALMDHPGIARVFDAGATAAGRPYFVMEFIDGVPITEYCDTARLPIPDRLDLFMQVCQAVQHAHQKGIIHRDLKPSNVLVTLQDGKPVPKVIDFGVAKATAAPLTEKTVVTEQRQFIGTPEYMSPEQADLAGLDIDTRSDVYSLGVLLYELLTGTTLFDHRHLRSAAYGEMQRMIREVDPATPSTRLSRLENLALVAACRQTEPRRLGAMVRGDLDWIVMRCVEKDRSRRYESASSLAADLHRHLLGEAVAAAPPSAMYRTAKFVRRHRVGVVATAALALTLVGGVIATTWQAVRAMRAESQAVALAAKSRQIATFIQQMLAGVDPRFAQGKETVLLRKILDDTAKRIETELAGQHEVEAAIRDTLGTTYLALGEYTLAQSHLETALDTRRRVLGNDHPDTLESINNMGSLLQAQGKLAEAEPYYREAMEGRRSVLGDDHADTLSSISDMGAILQLQGKFAEAEPYYLEALAGRRRVLGDDHRDTLESISNMGYFRQTEGKLAEAEPYWRQAMEGLRRVLGDDHPDTLTSISNMAMLLQSQGKLAEAEPYHREALAGRRRVLSDDHPDTMSSISNLGFFLQAQGKLAEAEWYYREALESRRRVLREDHPDTLLSMNNMGSLLRDQGRLYEAESYGRDAVDRARQALPEGHWRTGTYLSNYGRTLALLERREEAEAALLEAHQVLSSALGAGHERTIRVIDSLVALYDAWGRTELAAEWRAKLPKTHEGPATG